MADQPATGDATGDDLDQDLKNGQPGTDDGTTEQDGEGDTKRGPTGWVPKVRLDEMGSQIHSLKSDLEQEREARIRLEEQLKNRSAPPKLTKAALREAVAVGEMTQEQADDAWEQQLRRDITAEVVSSVTSATSQQQTLTEVTAELDRYKSAAPDLMVEGSELRTQVKAKFARLVKLGSPATRSTELAAVEAVLGSIERVEQGAKGRPMHQHQQESGGGGRPDSGGAKKSLLEQAPERYRQYYEGLIARGQITKEQAEKDIARTGLKVLQERAKRYGT